MCTLSIHTWVYSLYEECIELLPMMKIVYVKCTQLCTFLEKCRILNEHNCVSSLIMCKFFENCILWMYKIVYILWENVYVKCI